MKNSRFCFGLLLGVWMASAGAAWAKDAVFESSDGLWTDGTYESKGREFFAVLLNFERYKMSVNKPELTLVRVTPEPKDGLLRSKQDKLNPKWKVPFAAPSGRAKTDVVLQTQPPATRAQIEEAERRAAVALAYWQNKQ